MRLVFSVLTILSAMTIIPAIIEIINTKMRKAFVKELVNFPKFLLWVGMIGTIFFSVVYFFAYLDGADLWVLIIFTLFSLLGSSLIISYFNIRIKYDDESFIKKNFFGISKTYKFAEITRITEKNDAFTIYAGGKRIRIDKAFCGDLEFMSLARKALVRNKNAASPYVIKEKYKLFNGNIANPGEFIFIYIFFEAIFIGMVIWLSLIALPGYSYNVTFQNSSIEKSDLIIYCSETNVPLYVYDYKTTMSDSDGFLNNIKTGDELVVVSHMDYKEASKNSEKIVLSGITANNINYLFDSKYEEARSNKILVISIFLGFAVLWGVLIAISVHVLSNATKYTRRFIRFFVKPGYVLCKMKDDKVRHHKHKR